MYENNQTYCSGHIKGYVTDGNIYPSDSVQNCNNIDFEYGKDKRRLPYSKHSVAGDTDISELAEGYSIIGIYEKTFYDADGHGEVCLIAVCRSNDHAVKIFVNKYFNPSSDYGNRDHNTTGWRSQWVEITEGYYHDYAAAIFDYDSLVSSSPRIYKYIVTADGSDPAYMFDKPDQYFRGFFLYNSSGVCIGQITSFLNNDNVTFEFEVGINSIVAAGSPIAYPGVFDPGTYTENQIYLVRFPVNKFAYDYFKANDPTFTTNDIDFEDTYNSVKICLGKFRTLELSFLQQKTYWDAGQIDSFKRGWNGFYFAYDIPNVENIATVRHLSAGTGAGTTEYYDRTSIGEEFGIRYEVGIASQSVTSEYHKDHIHGLTITIKGYQSVFIKHTVGSKWSSMGTLYTYTFNTQVHLLVDFDRRITDINHFAFAKETVFTNTFQNLVAFRYADDYGGIIETTSGLKITATGNYYHVDKNIVYNEIRDYATGTTLMSCLNQKYYHSPVSAFRLITKVGNNLVGADINQSYLGDNTRLNDSYGHSKIVISNIQYQGYDGTPVNADNSYSEERIRQLIQGEKITAIAGTIGLRFLLFTNKNLFYYEINDEKTGSIKEGFDNYLFKGTYTQKTIVKAQMGDQFAGVYWLGKDSIYRFLYDKPEDILSAESVGYDRWKQEYQLLTEEDKELAVCGFNARTRDVYFVISDKIYIWNLSRELWKIYTYIDIPEDIITSESGEIYFSSGNNIFKTENSLTELYKDETSSGDQGISFSIFKRIADNTKITNKILDKVDVVFSAEEEYITGEPQDINIVIKAGYDGTHGNIIDKEININGLSKLSIVIGKEGESKRVNAKYVDIELKSDDTAGSIKNFELRELNINTILGVRQLSRA